jgi:signal transduction histidine kinase
MFKFNDILQSVRFPGLKLAASAVIAFSLGQFSFYGLNFGFFDFLSSKIISPKSSGQISLLHLTQDDLKELGREPSLVDLAVILRELSSAGAKGALILTQRDSASVAPTELAAFNAALENSQMPILWGIDEKQADGRQPISKLGKQLKRVKYTDNRFSMDVISFAADSIARRTLIKMPVEEMPISVLAATEIIQPDFQLGNISHIFEYNKNLQVFTRHRPESAFRTFRFTDVLSKKAALESFKDKFVIIGRDAVDWTDDYAKTPLSKALLGSPRTVIYASSIETLLNNDSLYFGLNVLGSFIMTFLISYITVIVLFSMSPHISLIVVTALGLVVFAAAIFLFATFQVMLPIAQFLIALLITYYFFIPYRLIQESRKSWEYLQKNKLLTEVERLKTNFLSMMSHDLKTPLARIQGMADMALAHPENLTPEQKTALQSIGTSTDELTNFISGILDLGRVESQEVKLQLQARDINSLLEEAIVKSEETAKSKNIQIIREFEPLFSTKVDTTLMRQVFTNLIENAVKYSPNGSKILVSTEEVDGHIQVQVADQGIGIPQDELSHVFTKFYRSHLVKNGPIKGSGLGLFLAKYFVELHKGRITVESVPEQGSTFTVDLPMN